MEDNSYHGRGASGKADKKPSAPWVRMPAGALDELIDLASKAVAAGSWPDCLVVADLVAHQDKANRPYKPVPFPGRRELARRWGWTEREARTLLADEPAWKDPTKITRVPVASQSRPSDVPAASQSRPDDNGATPEVDGGVSRQRPSRVPVASQSRPSDVHTRVESQPPSPSHEHKHLGKQPVDDATTSATTSAPALPKSRPDDVDPRAEAVERLADHWRSLDGVLPLTGANPLFGMLHHAPGEDVAAREAVVRRVLDFMANAPDKAHGWDNTPSWLRGTGAHAIRHALDKANGMARFASLLTWSETWHKAGRPSRHATGPTVSPAEAEWDAMAPHLAQIRARGLRTAKSPSGALLGHTDDEHARRFAAFERAGGWAEWANADSDGLRNQIKKRWIAAWSSK